MIKSIFFYSLIGGIILWFLALLSLAIFSNITVFWSSLAIITFLSVLGVISFLQIYRQYLKILYDFNNYRAIYNTLGKIHEIGVFDENGKTIFTTHPHAYPHKREFLRKLLMRIGLSHEASVFKQWVEEHHKSDIVLTSGGNGLGQQQRSWLAHVCPIEPYSINNNHLLLTTLTEVTPYIEGFNNLKSNYSQLENFIDQAPLGIIYINATQHIVGLNKTFAEWLELDKSKILGEPLHNFIEKFPSNFSKEKMTVISFKPHKRSPFKALLVSSSFYKNSNINALFICKLEKDISLFYEHDSTDYLSQLTFLYAPIPAIIIEQNGTILSFNPAFTHMLEEAISTNSHAIKADDKIYSLIHSSIRTEIIHKIQDISQSEHQILPFEIKFEGLKAHTATAYVSRLNNTFNSEQIKTLMIQFIDISEQKRLEEQFIQSQKMQAVGQLAGGIAHDFNNLLTAMIGFCDLLLQRYMPNDPAYTDIVQIKQNANRAANLVRQLLAFSRQQNLQPKVINITDTLAELSALLRRLIGAGIDLQMIHGRDLWPVKVDESQFEQVIINLAVNARDAMSHDGTLIIRTGHYHCERANRIGHDIMPVGDYVLIEMTDTGCGIASENLEHIFEPFFSTKEIGSGTGLGLSTVYGIVKQTGGFVTVDSEVTQGTTFKIFLPRYEGKEEIPMVTQEHPTGDLTGTETVLLVEDEDAVRLFSARALREKGYRVLEANSWEAALEIVHKKEKFDLLITDVVMPKMDGPTLSKKVRDMLPQTKIIFISGYSEDTFRKNLDHDAKIHFLQKPFTLKDLSSKVKEVLHASKTSKKF